MSGIRNSLEVVLTKGCSIELSPKVRLITQSSVAVGGIVALGGLGSLDFGLFSIENQLFTNIIAFVAVIWFDATLTLFRRYRNGEKLSEAHRKHAYQRLTQSGWVHDKVVLFSMGVNVVLFGLVYFISNVFVAFLLALVFLYGVMRFVDFRKAF